MFKKLRNETKKALTRVGAFIEASLEATGEILDDISDMDFD